MGLCHECSSWDCIMGLQHGLHHGLQHDYWVAADLAGGINSPVLIYSEEVR